jgi:hypothetical protein
MKSWSVVAAVYVAITLVMATSFIDLREIGAASFASSTASAAPRLLSTPPSSRGCRRFRRPMPQRWRDESVSATS